MSGEALCERGLLVEGFPDSFSQDRVAELVASETRTCVKHVARALDRPKAWVLLLESHESQKHCLQNHSDFTVTEDDTDYTIRLIYLPGKSFPVDPDKWTQVRSVRGDAAENVRLGQRAAECDPDDTQPLSDHKSGAHGLHSTDYLKMDYFVRREPIPCPLFHSPSDDLYIEPTKRDAATQTDSAYGQPDDRKSCGSTVSEHLYETPDSLDYELPQQSESEQQNIVSRTVEFRLTQSALRPDVIWQYFDSLTPADEGGGGYVEFITEQGDQRSAQVTFTSKDIAHRAVLRHPPINGEAVKIKPCVPPRRKPPGHDLTYPDKFLFKNVPENIGHSFLELYLEVVAKARPVEILYGDDPGMVVATFEQHLDLGTVQKECEKRLLDGKVQLSVSPVPVSACILVENLTPSATEDMVRLYFDSLRDQGGLVERVHMQQSGTTQKCFVHFHEHTAVHNVLTAKSHIIDKQEVRVKPYLEYLGPSGGSTDPSQFPLPPALILKVDKLKRALILQSPEAADLFYKHLSQVHAEVRFFKDTLKFVCTLTHLAHGAENDIAHSPANTLAHASIGAVRASLTSGGCMRKGVQRVTQTPRQIVKNWVGNVRQVVYQFFEQVEVQNVSIPEDVWEEVKDNLNTQRIRPWPAKTTYVLIEKDTVCAVVGMKTEAREFSQLIDQRVKDLKERSESKSKRVGETHIKLKPYELRLLEAKSFDKELKGKYKGLDVDLDAEKNEIIFSGLSEDVKQAQSEMTHFVKSIKSRKLSRFAFSSTQKVMLGTPETADFIDTELKSFGFKATWRKGTHEDVKVYGFRKNDLDQAVQVIQQAVFEEEITNLDPGSVEKLRSTEWGNHAETLLSKHRDSVKISPSPDKRKMVITGRKLLVKEVKAELIRSFSEHGH